MVIEHLLLLSIAWGCVALQILSGWLKVLLFELIQFHYCFLKIQLQPSHILCHIHHQSDLLSVVFRIVQMRSNIIVII